ncbi:hypothetical protein [Paenibacillus sp. HGF5]|uniref:hypothetical protein n=1 Tax=Paenibacillus sp. HGF5 TaxID=908341 RepID=UPI0002072E78|nr:hypothetical protein [Paenibacillus sp. HGF5]EGG37565.1 conserved domain protein [Paenibacillus sp. HGF5]
MRRSAYVSFLQSLLFPNFMNENSNVEIRQQRRPLRFSGIDSSAPLVRRMASFFIVGGWGEGRAELHYQKLG